MSQQKLRVNLGFCLSLFCRAFWHCGQRHPRDNAMYIFTALLFTTKWFHGILKMFRVYQEAAGGET